MKEASVSAVPPERYGLQFTGRRDRNGLPVLKDTVFKASRSARKAANRQSEGHQGASTTNTRPQGR